MSVATKAPPTGRTLATLALGALGVLLHHPRHTRVLHEKVMLKSIATEEIPQGDAEDRVECREPGEGFYQVMAHHNAQSAFLGLHPNRVADLGAQIQY